MSLVLKKLSVVSSFDKSLICKHGVYLGLYHSSVKTFSSFFRKFSIVEAAHSSRKSHKLCTNDGSHFHLVYCGSPQSVSKPIRESRRTMSILTDLLRRKKQDDDDEEEIPEAKVLPLFEEGSKGLSEEEIEAKRNVSRLNRFHQRLVHGQHPYTEPVAWFHHTVRYKQRMFGKYGESSGVNPGLLWPTKDELKERIEYEKISNPFSIKEMVEKKQAIRQAEYEKIQRRIKEVEEKMAMVEKFKDELAKKQEAKEREANEAKERREKLMEEVRRHFGYTVDPRDERFQELLAKKEKEQKKSMKEARKLEKQQRILQKLEDKSQPKKKASAAETTEDKDNE